ILSDTLADKDRTMVRLIDASESVLEEISRRRDELAAALGDGWGGVTTMAAPITEKRAELDRILTRLDTITDVVADREEDVDTLLSWAGPTFWQGSRIGSHGPWIDVLPTSLGPDIIGTLAEIYPQLGLNGGTPAP